MKQSGPGSIRLVAVFALLLTSLFFTGCQQSHQENAAMAAAPGASSDKVFVVFEGPWAVAPDPKEANKILLIAPKTKSHNDLYVAASNDATLTTGVYDLSVPLNGTPGNPTTAADFAQGKTTAADLQNVLNSKSQRYVVRLPKPEAYLAASRFTSRVGPPPYPPGPGAQKEYVTAVSLQYSVSSMSGFSLSGTPDSGSFNAFQPKVEASTVTFMIDPTRDVNALEPCHAHSREAFRDLTRLLKVSLYIDFPDSQPSCQNTDPQKTKAEKIEPFGSDSLQALLFGNVTGVQQASLIPRMPGTYFFFTRKPVFCTGAIIMLAISG